MFHRSIFICCTHRICLLFGSIACGLNYRSNSQLCHILLIFQITQIPSKPTIQNNFGLRSVNSASSSAAFLLRLSVYHISCLSKSSSQTVMGWAHAQELWVTFRVENPQLLLNCICTYTMQTPFFPDFLKYRNLALAYGLPSSSARPSSSTVCPSIDYLTREKHYTLLVPSCCLSSF